MKPSEVAGGLAVTAQCPPQLVPSKVLGRRVGCSSFWPTESTWNNYRAAKSPPNTHRGSSGVENIEQQDSALIVQGEADTADTPCPGWVRASRAMGSLLAGADTVFSHFAQGGVCVFHV